jgi:SagB-type dehydrogenase family enzyme
MIIPLQDGQTLSRLFHINSEPWSNTEAYRQAQAHEVEYKETAGADALALPPPTSSSLLSLVSARRSCRAYELREVSLEVFSTILKCGYGIARMAPLPGGGSVCLRTVPSAGGLYPLEVYVLARKVTGLQDAIYHYSVRRHSIELLRDGSWFGELDDAMLAAPFIRNANLIFFLSAVFGRTQKKYGPRGYRYILLEAGHLAQNLCLAAAEQKLGSLCIGGYLDARLTRFLDLDASSEAVVYSVALGYPDDATESR